MSKYVIETNHFHSIRIKNTSTGEMFGLFDRFEKPQLQDICDKLNNYENLLKSQSLEKEQLMVMTSSCEDQLQNVNVVLDKMIYKFENDKQNFQNEGTVNAVLCVNLVLDVLNQVKREIFPEPVFPELAQKEIDLLNGPVGRCVIHPVNLDEIDLHEKNKRALEDAIDELLRE